MTASLEKELRSLATTTLRIQPVEPPELTSEEIGKRTAYIIVGVPALLTLFSWFLWLAWGTVHDLFPAVPPTWKSTPAAR